MPLGSGFDFVLCLWLSGAELWNAEGAMRAGEDTGAEPTTLTGKDEEELRIANCKMTIAN